MKRFCINNTLFFLFAIISIVGCKKFVAVDPPSNLISSDALFSSDQGAISAVSGLYSQMTSANLSMTNGGIAVFSALSSDELINSTANNNYDPFRKNELSADNARIASGFWSPAYKNIYQANVILENLSNSKSVSEATKKQLRGEMLVVRAFHYFYLLNLFGDVPYLTTSDYKSNAVSGRTTTGTVYAGIIGDLLEAQQLLSENYPTATKGRPNKWTATALLARIYLYQKDWTNAEMQASAIINSGKYGLAGSLNSVFLPTSTEVIWLLQRDNNNTAEANSFIPSSPSVIPSLVASISLLNAFEAGDNRKLSWLGKNTVNGKDYYYVWKYKQRLSSPISEFEVVLRLSEMFLIRAEAKANLNKLAEAQTDLNSIRNRAGLPNTTANDNASLLSAIEHERQVELFAEWGHRWLDLKRTDRTDAVLSLLKPSTWQTTDQLYPIPLNELLSNPHLTQNAGY